MQNTNALPTLDQVQILSFPIHQVAQRNLMVMETAAKSPQPAPSHLPYAPRRIFTVEAKRDHEIGGGHAHYECQQILIPMVGEIEVICRAPASHPTEAAANPPSHMPPSLIPPLLMAEKKFRLVNPNQALYIPPGVWGEQIYQNAGDLLLVLCDLIYDENDYIRNWQNYLRWINAHCDQTAKPHENNW
ncbi:MAG: FdtA/QdtA family cupin domain-containing protein [Candidatus Symbiobacter sp.]|nr:FdtA/QdtA family cupin domain-containing protein [Candidatus Symbiobacter sp.]